LGVAGRAGFVMSSQASSAGHGEAEVRRKLVQAGDVDVMVAIRPNFFYTRTVPCELWFYDRGKPAERRDTVLMLDARQVFRKVTRKIYDFSPEQLADLTAVVWLYRGQHERFEALVAQHLRNAVKAAQACWCDDEAEPACAPLDDYARAWQALRTLMQPFVALLPTDGEHAAVLAEYADASTDPLAPIESLRQATGDLAAQHAKAAADIAGSTEFHSDTLLGLADQARALSTQLDHATRATLRMLDLAEKQLAAKDDAAWPTREIGRARKALEAARGGAVEHLKWVRHFQRHAAWLIERFPDARYFDVQGLCRAVTRAEIEAADWSLTPGRYVGVAAVAEDEDFDFGEAMREIHAELAALNAEATRLAQQVQQRFEELA
jgi:type I restriction enzyme M protein